MIRITAELISANDGKTYPLGIAYIYNDGSAGGFDSDTIGNYEVIIGKKGKKNLWANSNQWRTGQVKGFPRKKLGVWDLLYRALHNTVGDRK